MHFDNNILSLYRKIKSKWKDDTQLFLSGLILLLAILTSIADSKIQDFTNKIISEQGYGNNLLINQTKSERNMSDSQMYAFLNFPTSITQVHISSYVNDIPELKAISNDFLSGSSTAQEFHNQLSLFYFNESKNYYVEYSKNLELINMQINNGTIWTLVKRVLLIAQTILILYSIYLIKNKV